MNGNIFNLQIIRSHQLSQFPQDLRVESGGVVGKFHEKAVSSFEDHQGEPVFAGDRPQQSQQAVDLAHVLLFVAGSPHQDGHHLKAVADRFTQRGGSDRRDQVIDAGLRHFESEGWEFFRGNGMIRMICLHRFTGAESFPHQNLFQKGRAWFCGKVIQLVLWG